MYGYVYKTTNLVNGKIYIGQKKSEEFLNNQYLGSGRLLKLAIECYGKENFDIELLEECYSKQQLNDRERFYIKEYKSQDRSIGYNIVGGGESGAGSNGYDWFNNGVKETRCKTCPTGWVPGRLPMSEECKQHISEAHKGKSLSEETREKLRQVKHPSGENHHNYGKHLSKETREKIGKSKENISDETREKLRQSRLGKHLSEETKLKISKNSKSGTPEVRAKISKNNKSGTPEVRQKLSDALKGNIPANKGKIWVTNGEINKFIAPEELDSYIVLNYRVGVTRKKK